jgi:hypothetical protein
LNINRKIDPVEDRTTDSIAVFLTAAGCVAAFPFAIAEIPAPAWIHCCHELEARGIGYVCRCSRDSGAPRFHRLAQRLQCLAGEFRQLIQKQYASVCQGHFPGPGT